LENIETIMLHGA